MAADAIWNFTKTGISGQHSPCLTNICLQKFDANIFIGDRDMVKNPNLKGGRLHLEFYKNWDFVHP